MSAPPTEVALHRLQAMGPAVRADHSSTSGVLIDVGWLDAIAVVNGLVQVGAGALLGDLYDTLERVGLTTAGGTCPTVGISGLTLVGGLGILGRSYGLTSDRPLQATVVLADGQTVTCGSKHHPELRWALQGAGANNFGVATALTSSTTPFATTSPADVLR